MKGKKVVFCFVVFFLAIFFPTNVYSLGVSVNRLIEFEPNLDESYMFCVRNSKSVDQEVTFNITGALAKYMEMNSGNKITLSPSEIKCTSYHVKLPEKLEKPGIRSTLVEVKEVPKKTFGGGLNFNIIVAVKHKFSVRVPYPGKYVDFDLNAWDIKENEKTYFAVQTVSRGTETIEKITGIAEVYQLPEEKSVGIVSFSEIENLKTAETAEMFVDWDSVGQKPGNYKVVAKLDYDGNKEELEKSFRIGTLRIDIINHTKETYNGSINKFDVIVRSNWNENINNVYADVEIKKGSYTNTFKTPQENVGKWETKTISGYWDTTKADPGDYDITITLNYAGKTTVKKGTIRVVERVGEEVMEKAAPSIFNTTTLLIMVIVIIVLFDIIWFLKKKKK